MNETTQVSDRSHGPADENPQRKMAAKIRRGLTMLSGNLELALDYGSLPHDIENLRAAAGAVSLAVRTKIPSPDRNRQSKGRIGIPLGVRSSIASNCDYAIGIRCRAIRPRGVLNR